MNTFVFDSICPHRGFHLDEVVPCGLVKAFGGDKIQLAPGCQIEPCKLSGSEAENIAAGRWPLGQCQGLFDDKDGYGRRIPNTSTTSKVASFLGVPTAVNPLIRAVTLNDSEGGSSPTELPALTRCMLYSNPFDQQAAIYLQIDDAVCMLIGYLMKVAEAQAEGKTLECTDYVRPTNVVAQMIKDDPAMPISIQLHLKKIVRESERNIGEILELSSICRAYKVCGESDENTATWARMMLDQVVIQQSMFQEAITELLRNQRKFPVYTSRDGTRKYAALIRSDNAQVGAASRSKDFMYEAIIIRRRSGNLSIFPNTRDDAEISYNHRIVWALIRMEDSSLEDRARAEFRDYCEPGNHPSALHWHMMDHGPALNGTLGIEARPSTMTNDRAMRITQFGYQHEDAGFNEFKRMRSDARRELAAQRSETHTLPASRNGKSNGSSRVFVDYPGVSEETKRDLADAFDAGTHKRS
ncbi:MAG: hypothetical protein KGI59_02200 [Patescibacteria group bacterium]|nr:hypothetical protein [Patescibacteria group bacterium]MDE2172732.1 hypothetical protein [Patescibacteria group bacterium]